MNATSETVFRMVSPPCEHTHSRGKGPYAQRSDWACSRGMRLAGNLGACFRIAIHPGAQLLERGIIDAEESQPDVAACVAPCNFAHGAQLLSAGKLEGHAHDLVYRHRLERTHADAPFAQVEHGREPVHGVSEAEIGRD